ncbi:MAG: heme biosynthesis protein HemY, partial [Martelella sp.]
MIRLLIFAIIVLAFALGFSWFADRPGELTLVWQGQMFETPLTTALALLLALSAPLDLHWGVLTAPRTPPSGLARASRAPAIDRGY